MASKEVDNLVKLLGKYTDMYSADEIMQAIIAEGYSHRTAKKVVEILFKNKKKTSKKTEEKQEVKPPVIKAEEAKEEEIPTLESTAQELTEKEIPRPESIEEGLEEKEIPKPISIEQEESTDFSEVDKLLSQLKSQISFTSEPASEPSQEPEPELAPEPTQESTQGSTPEPENKKEVKETEEDTKKVKEEPPKRTVVIPLQPKKEVKEKNVQNIMDKDLSQIPRRLRRFYRQSSEEKQKETEKEKKEETTTEKPQEKPHEERHYKERLKSLQEEKKEKVPLKDSITDIIYKQIREKTDIQKPREEIARITKQEVDRFRRRHNREPSKREEINEVVDNIFAQLTSPDLRAEEEKKYAESTGKAVEETKKEEKTEQKPIAPAGLDLNLPSFELGSKVSDSDLQDLDLNLDLNLDLTKKKEKKEEKKN